LVLGHDLAFGLRVLRSDGGHACLIGLRRRLSVQATVACLFAVSPTSAAAAAPPAGTLFALRVVPGFSGSASGHSVDESQRGRIFFTGNFRQRVRAAGFALGAWATAAVTTTALTTAFSAGFAPAFTTALATRLTVFRPFAIFIARGFAALRLHAVFSFRAIGAITPFVAATTAFALVVTATALAVAAAPATPGTAVATITPAVRLVAA
jgi:hypothetical protein